jgi:exonuclease SbcC
LKIDHLKIQWLIAKQSLKAATETLVFFESTTEDTLQPFRDNVEIAELELETFEFTEDFESNLKQFEALKEKNKKQADLKKTELAKVKDQFADDINKINNDNTINVSFREEYQQSLQEYEQFESDVNKQLQDTVECPKCKHQFSLRDKTFNVEEAKEALPGVQEEIKNLKKQIADTNNILYVDIPKRKQDVNDKIIKAGEGIKNDITALNSELVEVGSKEFTLKRKYQEEQQNKQQLANNVTARKRELKNKEDEIAHQKQQLQNSIKRAELTLQQREGEYQAHLQEIEQLQASIERLRTQEADRTKIEKLTRDIEVLVKEEEQIKKKLEEKRKEKESVDAWEIHFKNFKSHLANQSIKNIQDYTNLFLEGMNSNLAINIDGYRTLSNKKLKEAITTSVLRDGFDAGSYGKFSGGERGRIDICTIIAMQELILLNSGGRGVDLLIADEILDQVDTLGLESIINSLQSLQKTIMIVSQNEINTLADYTLTVQKKNKVSTILN